DLCDCTSDQSNFRLRHLTVRGTSKLAYRFKNVGEAVDVGLRQVPAVGVDGDRAVWPLDGAALDERSSFTDRADPEGFQAHDDERCEVVVELHYIDVGG